MSIPSAELKYRVTLLSITLKKCLLSNGAFLPMNLFLKAFILAYNLRAENMCTYNKCFMNFYKLNQLV